MPFKIGAKNKHTREIISPENANKEDKYACISCDKEVLLKKGKIIQAHFSHKKDESCIFYGKKEKGTISYESYPHLHAKHIIKYLLENKIEFFIKRKCRRCKEKEKKYDLKKLYSLNYTVDLEYKYDPNSNKTADIACVNPNGDILCIFEICHSNPTLESSRPSDIVWFEFDAQNVMEIVADGIKKTSRFTIECTRKIYECGECIDRSLSEEKGIIYFNQRGAGCGKTYESCQLLQSYDKKYNSKTTFFYLTKMNSAVEVIYTEMMDQYASGRLEDLEMLSGKDKHQDFSGKKYIIPFKNKKDGRKIQVCIGTIDSFANAVYDKNERVQHYDRFKGIILMIRDGKIDLMDDERLHYAGKNYILSKECLIVIDEAQDLGKEYIQAFDVISEKTNIDIYVIGDKLQSIWDGENLFTYIENSGELKSRIEKSEGKNIVMRFHNDQFTPFVNSIVPFEKYNLPPIQGICSGENGCRYKHENDVIPHTIFEMIDVYRKPNVEDEDKYKIYMANFEKSMVQLLDFMDYEIRKYNYLPKHFMFIFPILSKNIYASALSTRLQNFWVEKFEDEEYLINIKEKHNFEHKSDAYHQYVFLHKSDEGTSINLKESENATRIVSIHTSKGNGREVVFLLGVNEYSLKIFTDREKNIVYESLLHVALTRQKKSLYIGVVNNSNDDIRLRLEPYEIIKNRNIEFDITPFSKKKTDITKIVSYLEKDALLFQEFRTHFPIFEEEKSKLIARHTKNIIDMGHHLIRYCTMFFIFFWKLSDNPKKHRVWQFHKIINHIKNADYSICFYNEYLSKLKKINDVSACQMKCDWIRFRHTEKCKLKDQKDFSKIKYDIPILSYSKNVKSKYYRYATIFSDIKDHLIKKLNHYENSTNRLCPMECIILYFLSDIISHGTFSETTITEIYSIMFCYELCSSELKKSHDKFQCSCKKVFTKIDCNLDRENALVKSIKYSIKEHYDLIKNIDTIFGVYSSFFDEKIGEVMEYNQMHTVCFQDAKENFRLKHRFSIIGYSEKNVIPFMIKPSYNEINFNSIIAESIFIHFLLLNCSGKNNPDRYHNKKIYTTVLSIEYSQPIIYDFEVLEKDKVIGKILRRYFMDEHQKLHSDFYKCFSNCKTNSEKCDVLAKLCESFDKHDGIPSYIKIFFGTVEEKMQIKNRDKVIEKFLGDEEIFKKQLGVKLVFALDKFLGKEQLE